MGNKTATRQIKKALIDKNWTVRDLSQKIKRSYTLTSYVINCQKVATPTRQLIASHLGFNYTDLWGETVHTNEG